MAENAEKTSGLLSKVFKGAAYAVTIGLGFDLLGDLLIEPLFLPVFHSTSNTTAMAWSAMINDKFGWITDALGFGESGGLLKNEFFSNMLEPYIAEVAPPPANEIKEVMTPGLMSELGIPSFGS